MSVVIVAQPITAWFRATQGATTAADATTTRRPTTTARRPGRMRHAANGATTSGRSSRRAFDRTASPATAPAAIREPGRAPVVGEEREEDERGEQDLVDDLPVDVHVVPDEVRVQRRDEGGDDADPDRREVPADREHEQRRDDREGDLGEPDDDPRAVERPVEGGEEPCVERLRVGGRDLGQEAERPARDERPRERVALLDVLLEDVVPLDREGEETRQRGGRHDEGDRAAWYALRDAAHDSGTVRRGLLSRRTAARRPRLGGVRRAAGAASRAVSRSRR